MATSTILTADRDAIEKLVCLYRDKEYLWNTTHKLYANQHARRLALRAIAEAMGADWTEQLVRQKITTIRSSYARERRKRDCLVRIGAGLEDTFVSTWWLFDLLDGFLAPHNQPNRTSNNQSASHTLQSSQLDEASDGMDSDPTVDDAEDMGFLDEDGPTSQTDMERLVRQVRRTASPMNQSSSSVTSVSSVSTSSTPDDSQRASQLHREVARPGSSGGTKRRQPVTAADLSESIAKCAATVEQRTDRFIGSRRTHDENNDFGVFVANYLRRMTNPEIRDEAMFEIHKVLRESMRKQNNSCQHADV